MTNTKIVIIGSTRGSILSKISRHTFVRDMIAEAISDRPCPFLSVAESFGIKHQEISSATGSEFSDALADRYKDQHELIFLSFYTRLFSGSFVDQHMGRIFNCHPSILPAFKGMRGFEETLESTSTFMGSTLHVVTHSMDSGPIIIQAALPLDRSISEAENRHKIFLSQYYSTLQFFKWIKEGRLLFASNHPGIVGAKYTPSIFSPNLDADFFSFIDEPNELLNY